MIAKTSTWLALVAIAVFSHTHCRAAQSAAPPDLAAPTAIAVPNAIAAERPATPPQVKCEQGQLTIVANGSTMRSIFAALHSCLGLEILVPEGAEGTRTYAALGPGPVRAVLESLLASSDYDYVLRASAARPDRVEAVVLMARNLETSDTRTGQAPAGLVLTPARTAWLENLRSTRHPEQADEEQPAAPSQPTASAALDKEEPVNALPADMVATSPTVSGADSPVSTKPVAAIEDAARPTSAEDANRAPADTSTTPAPSKEVQQKINSMEQMFEQRKQMMEGQNAAPKPQ